MKFLCLLGTFLFLAPVSPSQATTFAPREFPAGVQDAPNIVRGKVGMTYSDWGKSTDGIRRLYTFYELQIEEVIKGNIQGRSLVMRELGGQKDGVGLEVPGSARFERGEDVVVFLSAKSAENVHDLRGLMMGKYNIQRDAEGKEYLVGPGISGDPEAAHGHGGHAPEPRKWTLDALRELVAQQARAGNATPSGASASSALPPSPRPSGEAPRLQSPAPQGTAGSPAGDESNRPEGQQATQQEDTGFRPWIGWGIAGLAAFTLLLLWMLRRRS